MRPRRVGVIFGGRSGEHEVSLASAASVIAALQRRGHVVIPLGIARDGRWVVGGDPMRVLSDEARRALPAGDATGGVKKALADRADTQHAATSSLARMEPPGSLPAELRQDMDVAVIMLHGPYGEDGTIQGLLELAGVPYTGAGVMASAIGMDKAMMKTVFSAHGLPLVPHVVIMRHDWERDANAVAARVAGEIGFPCFVKPANLGSSVGISKVKTADELPAGVDEAARHDRKIVVERGIAAREIEVSVLGNDVAEASLPCEIVYTADWYDYETKYMEGLARLLIPAPISPELTARFRALAIQTFHAIDAAGMARVDFFLEGDDRIYVNEINTIPGFTSTSGYAKMWEATGVDYPTLIDRLVELALDRHHDMGGARRTPQSPPRSGPGMNPGPPRVPTPSFFVICGGGTGGHTSPGLAVATALQARGHRCAWIGSRDGVEARRVPAAGIEYVAIPTGKLRRYWDWRNVSDLLVNVPAGLAGAWRALGRLSPRAVFGTGGFVALPVVTAAALRGIPAVIHEQTAVPGLANRVSAPFARRIAVTYADSARHFPSAKVVVTGNPVRPELRRGSRADALARYGFDPALPVIYVTGGAQGAHRINRAVGDALRTLLAHAQIVHQCGDNPTTGDHAWLRERRAALAPALAARYAVTPFVGAELADLFAAASLVIGRAGAGTVNECCQLGVAALYVPLPGTSGDEQTANARLVERAGGAEVLPQDSLTPATLADRVLALVAAPDRLKTMGERATGLAVPDAVERIADLLEAL